MDKGTQTLLKIYETRIARGDLTRDERQEQALAALGPYLHYKKSLFRFGKSKTAQGVYFYGGVGRGKTMIMDMFYDAIPHNRKKRIHFHQFMIDTHKALTGGRVKNARYTLPKYVDRLAREVDILCFDEFQVTNIVDAMLLSRLFAQMFDRGMVIISTSNRIPDDLYKDGLQRDSFLPFIDLVKEKMAVFALDGLKDYRKAMLAERDTYFAPLTAANRKSFEDLYTRVTDGEAPAIQLLPVRGRSLRIQVARRDIARASFADLCEKPLGAEDYIALANAYRVLFLEAVPTLNYDRRNEAARLIALIDALYEARTRLVVLAEAAPDQLYRGSDHGFEFDRTISRLIEMQSQCYGD